jgi:hypothetical protein
VADRQSKQFGEEVKDIFTAPAEQYREIKVT